jgi:hypothetical protein
LPGLGKRWAAPFGPRIDLSRAPGFDVPHPEGSDVGYRWFARMGHPPLFPFGYGLSYTAFSYANLAVTGGDTLTVTFDVTNTGPCEGIDTPQVYLSSRRGAPIRRLLGWSRLRLKPGERAAATITADPRLLADFDNPDTSAVVGHELVGTSISSVFPDGLDDLFNQVTSGLPWADYANASERGYVTVELTEEVGTANWRVVDTTTAETSGVRTDFTWEIPVDDPGGAPSTGTTAPVAATPRFTG